jgi:hypothetical protein
MKKSVKQCTQGKIKKVMGEYKRHDLKMQGGKKVSKRKQAIAIGLSKARKTCHE